MSRITNHIGHTEGIGSGSYVMGAYEAGAVFNRNNRSSKRAIQTGINRCGRRHRLKSGSNAAFARHANEKRAFQIKKRI